MLYSAKAIKAATDGIVCDHWWLVQAILMDRTASFDVASSSLSKYSMVNHEMQMASMSASLGLSMGSPWGIK